MLARSICRVPLIFAFFYCLSNCVYAQDGNPYGSLDRGTAVSGPPKGWLFSTNTRWIYNTWTDVAAGLQIGTRCSIIAVNFARSGPATGSHIGKPTIPESKFATVFQAISSENYRGKRVRFSAQISSVEVSGKAALWMRIDGPNEKALNFDNMASHPISGTTSWQQQEIVLDVPQESSAIKFGFLLAGDGEVKAANFTLDVVDANAKTTANGVPLSPNETLTKTPVNLELSL